MKPLILSMLLLSSSVFADQLTIENRSQNLIRVEYKLSYVVDDKYVYEDPVLSDFLAPSAVAKIEVPNHDELTGKIYNIGKVLVYDLNKNFKFMREFNPRDKPGVIESTCYVDYSRFYDQTRKVIKDFKVSHGIFLDINNPTQDVFCSEFVIAN